MCGPPPSTTRMCVYKVYNCCQCGVSCARTGLGENAHLRLLSCRSFRLPASVIVKLFEAVFVSPQREAEVCLFFFFLSHHLGTRWPVHSWVLQVLPRCRPQGDKSQQCPLAFIMGAILGVSQGKEVFWSRPAVSLPARVFLLEAGPGADTGEGRQRY